MAYEVSSYAEFSRLLGYSVLGKSTNVIKSYCEKYHIDCTHFNHKNTNHIKRNPENIFILDSTASQATLRRWYLKGNYTEYKCAICGQLPIWNNQELTLTLDHIDGNNHNDTLTNLRWVCPNCDRQLDTFCARNFKNSIKYKSNKMVNHCVDCGTTIGEKATRCVACNFKYQRTVQRPEKEILLQEVAELGFCAVGRKYGVSDKTITKWCASYDLPTHIKDIKILYFGEIASTINNGSIIKKRAVNQLNKNTNEIIATYESMEAAARAVDSPNGGSHISDVCKGKRKTAYGYKWEYVEN